MKVGAIVFARMTSSRLPGKALAQIANRPLLGHVLDRLRRVRGLAGVALATSSDTSDDALAGFAAAEGIACWRGPLDNVVDRAAQCARWRAWDAFARICGDRVFLDGTALEPAVARMGASAEDGAELISNVMDGGVPAGLTVEVVRTRAMETVLRRAMDPHDLEHITRYLYGHPEEFRIEKLEPPPRDLDGLRFVVDTPRDLERARHVAAALDAPAEADFAQIVRLTREWEQRYGR